MKKIVYILFALICCACSTPREITYFQDARDGRVQNVAKTMLIKIQPEDKLSIFVKAKDEKLTSLFSLTGQGAQNPQNSLGYTVDSKGCIDFPILGTVKVNSRTREEVASYIKEELIKRNLVKDPVVTVEFQEMYYIVLGEVSSAGRKTITKDHVTILEAIAEAGDLTINGIRTNILVMRKEKDGIHNYHVNLTDAASLYSSPVYYIKQDDVIYVESNLKKQRESTVNGNNTLTIGFWMSLASFIMAVVTFLK